MRRPAQAALPALEAIAHLRRGLAVLEALPEGPERVRQELDLQLTLGLALRITKGYAAPEVEQAFVRAEALVTQLGASAQLFPVQRGLWGFHLIRAEYGTARTLAEQLLALAEQAKDPALLLEAHVALGLTLCWTGAFTDAQAHLEQGVALYDPQQHHDHAFRYGQDPGVAGRSVLAYVFWFLGYPDQAVAQINEALALARQRSHLFSLAYALQHAVMVAHGCQDAALAKAQAEVLVALTREQGFAFWLGPALILQGWAEVQQGAHEQGVARMDEGLGVYLATGARLASTVWYALLADAYGSTGREGLRLLDKAQAMAEETGEQAWGAELHRLRGELLLRQAQPEDEAAACFREALQVARRQKARSWERRAALSLSRLWQRQGKQEAARTLLEETRGELTEGDDVGAPEEAKALLAEGSET